MTPYAFIRALPADLPEPEISTNADDTCVFLHWWRYTHKQVRVCVRSADSLKFSTAWNGGQKRLPIAQIAEKIRGLKDVP